MLYDFAKPFIFTLDAEKAHRTTIAGLKFLPPIGSVKHDPILASEVAGLNFANPVGLAPGFDKNGEVPRAMLHMGFGAVEIGTLTPRPQAGNPKPRLFRLTEDRAVINRMGFNNDGQSAAIKRLVADKRTLLPGILGINIGANKDSEDRIADYVAGVENMGGYADYLTVNISSPNTPGLRALQDKGALTELLTAVQNANAAFAKPVFLKLAPDLEPEDIKDICEIALDKKLDALIVSNTTISRPDLKSSHAGEAGGLSGAPLKELALQRLRDFSTICGSEIPLIGVGGIENAADAYARIRAGASLVQLYSALVYEGPGLARRINRDLAKMLARDGFANVAEAVGTEQP